MQPNSKTPSSFPGKYDSEFCGSIPLNFLNLFDADETQYHPRNSFNLWREQVDCSAEPCRPEEIEVAHHIK